MKFQFFFLQVDAKEDIRSKLKELLAAEEEAMVKLSEQIQLSAIEEKRVKKKLGESDHVISREIEENNHQVPSMMFSSLIFFLTLNPIPTGGGGGGPPPPPRKNFLRAGKNFWKPRLFFEI